MLKVLLGLPLLQQLVSRGESDDVSDGSAKQLVAGLSQSKLATFKGAYVHTNIWEPLLTLVEERLCATEASKPPNAS